MQRFLQFELTVALKDRSKTFQLFTLALLSFAVTIIVISTFAHLSGTEQPTRSSRSGEATNYASFVSAPGGQMLHLKK